MICKYISNIVINKLFSCQRIFITELQDLIEIQSLWWYKFSEILNFYGNLILPTSKMTVSKSSLQDLNLYFNQTFGICEKLLGNFATELSMKTFLLSYYLIIDGK